MKPNDGYFPSFMTVHQVAEYLQLNEKKIYALVGEQRLPATKVTGKWMFPRELIDQWLLESSHGGMLLDRLLIGGPDDPLFLFFAELAGQQNSNHALVGYVNRDTRSALDLLASGRLDVALLHWGPEEESSVRHPALLELHRKRTDWILVGGIKRELGLVSRKAGSIETELAISNWADPDLRWVRRPVTDGVWRFFQDAAIQAGFDSVQLSISLEVSTERDAAAAVAGGVADIAPASRATANQFGLAFKPLGWEQIDMVMHRDIWFRRLFQMLLEIMTNKASVQFAERLGGYDFAPCGQLLWGDR